MDKPQYQLLTFWNKAMPSPGIDVTPTNEERTQILLYRCWLLQSLAVDNLERQWGREILLIGKVLGGALII